MLEKHNTPAKFLVGNNMDVMQERYSKIDRATLIGKDTFIIHDLKKIYSEDTPVLFISACLIYLNNSINIPDEKKLSDSQINWLSRNLLQIIGVVTIGELWLFFNQIMSGYFGVFYYNIDPMVLCGWARKYLHDRADIITKNPQLMIKIRNRQWAYEDEQRAINLKQHEKTTQITNKYKVNGRGRRESKLPGEKIKDR